MSHSIDADEQIRECALGYLDKHLRKARVDMARAEKKRGATQEMKGLRDKILALEYLKEIAMRKDGRREA